MKVLYKDDVPVVCQLSGKRLTLAYVPATQADADLIASVLPQPHADGSPILPSELPTSLPGYLIQLKPQLTLDGQIVATSSQAFTMGTDVYSAGGYTQLADPSQWDITPEDSNTVGNATAIGLSIQGISAAQLNQLKTRLEETKTKLQAQNFTGLSGEQISGDLLTATLWSWFAAAESHNRLSQTQANMVEMPGLSYGECQFETVTPLNRGRCLCIHPSKIRGLNFPSRRLRLTRRESLQGRH